MFRMAICIGLIACLPVHADEPSAPDARPMDPIRAAISRSLPLMQKSAAGHRDNRTCFACHSQGIPILALVSARAQGFDIDQEDLKKHMGHISRFLASNKSNYLKGRGQGGQVDTAGYALWTLEIGSWRPDETTAAVAEYLLQFNSDQDYWRVGANRPPSEVSRFTAAYLGLRGLKTYGTKEQDKRIEEKTAKVRAWLLKTPAKDTEDRVFRLWALKMAGAEPTVIQAAADELLKTQHDGGGWAQLPSMKPDAYATGSALVALHQAAGLSAEDAVYQRGVKYLLGTQLDDGSWFVHSRSKPFQTYFETGFPHGKDQFISAAASGWATTALALSCSPSRR